MTFFDFLLSLLALPVLAVSAYLFFLAVLSGRLTPPPYPPPRLRFDIVVPAHNEAAGITQTVKSLHALDYPAELRRVIVVADNCADNTAELARAAGATVLERTDTERRGKGYALKYAFDKSLADDQADAVVVIDADTVVMPNLLQAYAARLEAGEQAVQAEYGVLNRTASWRTRLMAIAFATFHVVRSSARERLHLSCGLRGNGMCFSREVVQRVPHEAYSLVEDLEYGIRLGLAGYRVAYAEEAQVLGEMVAGEQASRSQRRRWEGGRLRMAKQHALPLLKKAAEKGDPVLLDLAFDVLVPPLTYVVVAALVGLGLGALVYTPSAHAGVAVRLYGVATAMLAFYVLKGWWLSGVGLRGLLDLLYAPVYMVWKLALLLWRPSHKKDEWVRTRREAETAAKPES
jgi:cellulose synthase/poly-beta-1,6-N-acetylglucosamine synthase-like glycosyltransferase